jgi:bifunctional DNA-binding transcriptional regulator/antitoxin component of YhaV-PrlF toxin-antitoxin module
MHQYACMQHRRLIDGGSSYKITLPKEVMIKYNWNGGDFIQVKLNKEKNCMEIINLNKKYNIKRS